MSRHACRGVVLLGALTFAVTACSSPAAKAPAAHHHPPAKHKQPAPAVNITYPGPDGVQASWVVAENQRPGTTAWKIKAGTPSGIAGYASTTYAAAGARVKLYVSTEAARFRVEAYRMGYYQGDGGRLVWQSGEIPGTSNLRAR